MDDLIRWWLATGLIGVAALPYAYRFLRFLPDRGIAFARPLGLLLVAYALWLGAFSGLLPHTPGSAALLIAVLAAGGGWLAVRDWATLWPALRARGWYILAVEVVFVAFFAGVALLRSYDAAIVGTEKPFESAFFQALLRSETFGPRDPWYGGEPMSYYYFGYVLIGVVTQVTGTAPEVGFNLGVALTAGLAAAGAYGLVYNLAVAGERVRLGVARAAALLGPLLLLIVSNFEGVFENLAIRDLRAEWFYRAIAIENLGGPKLSDAWYPTEHWWWWRATRLGSSWNVQEFPFFSFLLGDLHAHVMVLPYALLMLAGVFNLWRIGERLDPRFVWRHAWVVAGVALVAGGLYVTNAWDFPTALVLLGLVVLARNITLDRGVRAWSVLGGAGMLAVVAVLAVVLYLPFYIGFTATPTRLMVTEVLYSERFIERQAVATPPFQFLVFWGPLLFPAVSYLAWRLRRLRPWRLEPAWFSLALSAGVGPLLMWCAAELVNNGFGGLQAELRARGHLTLTWALLIPLVVLAALVLLGEVFRADEDGVDGGRVLVAAAMLVALWLILFPEFFFILDIVVLSRHNTVFKFYYTAWLLLSVAGAAGVIDLVAAWGRRARAPVGGLRIGRAAWAGGGMIVLALALVYPVTASFARTRGFTGERTLDGLAYLRRLQPGEYEAAMWLRENLDGMPVVLEASGPEYSEGARVTARTGFPTVVGWINHEWQERGELEPVAQRVRDVETLYTTDDAARARALLDRYDVRYVYVGGYERERYGANAGATLARIGRRVYENPAVSIYAVEPVRDGVGPATGGGDGPLPRPLPR